MLSRVIGLFSADMGIDLGTANTLAANDFVKGTVTYETTA